MAPRGHVLTMEAQQPRGTLTRSSTPICCRKTARRQGRHCLGLYILCGWEAVWEFVNGANKTGRRTRPATYQIGTLRLCSSSVVSISTSWPQIPTCVFLALVIQTAARNVTRLKMSSRNTGLERQSARNGKYYSKASHSWSDFIQR